MATKYCTTFRELKEAMLALNETQLDCPIQLTLTQPGEPYYILEIIEENTSLVKAKGCPPDDIK